MLLLDKEMQWKSDDDFSSLMIMLEPSSFTMQLRLSLNVCTPRFLSNFNGTTYEIYLKIKET